MPKMKILILEDDPIIAADLRKISEKEGHEAKVITNEFERTINFFEEYQPHLMICDFRLSDTMVSTHLLERIISVKTIHIIFITAYYDHSTIQEINRINPDGYLTKPFREDQVVALIRKTNLVLENRSMSVHKLGISERELEILSLVSRGFTSSDIAKALKISDHTVNTHRRNLRRKLGAESSIEMVDISRYHHLI